MQIFRSPIMFYIAIGPSFVGLNGCRGVVPRILFGALWSVYLDLHFTRRYLRG